MAEKIVMPQLGESIAEGTIVKWLKKPGDAVDKDENVVLISTDKVEAEIPAPVSGVLTSIEVDAGKTVPVGTLLGYVGKAEEMGKNAGANAGSVSSAATGKTEASQSAKVSKGKESSETGARSGTGAAPADEEIPGTKPSPSITQPAQSTQLQSENARAAGSPSTSTAPPNRWPTVSSAMRMANC